MIIFKSIFTVIIVALLSVCVYTLTGCDGEKKEAGPRYIVTMLDGTIYQTHRFQTYDAGLLYLDLHNVEKDIWIGVRDIDIIKEQ